MRIRANDNRAAASTTGEREMVAQLRVGTSLVLVASLEKRKRNQNSQLSGVRAPEVNRTDRQDLNIRNQN